MPIPYPVTPPAWSRVGTCVAHVFAVCALCACGRAASVTSEDGAGTFRAPNPAFAVEAADPVATDDPEPGDPTNELEPSGSDPQASPDQGPDTPDDADASEADPQGAADPSTSVDCWNIDWTDAVVVTATDQSARELWAVSAPNGELCVWIDGEELDGYVLFLDTDADPGTGESLSDWPVHSGADYAVSTDGVEQALADGSWQSVPADVNVTTDGTGLMLAVDLDSFPLRSVSEIWLAFELSDANAVTSSNLPVAEPSASFVRVPLDAAAPDDGTGSGSSCETARPAACDMSSDTPAARDLNIGRGMIVEAYITIPSPTDTAAWGDCISTALSAKPSVPCMWERLKAAAAPLRDSQHDYWVTVNGPDNGPFPVGSPSWENAALVWDPIRAAGGRILGYVHTCNKPEDGKILFRDLQTVQNEIENWVASYPGLGGIWLDEFYPRYELFDAVADTPGQPPRPPSCPQADPCYAPADRAFLVNGEYKTGVQIQPEGGYYHRLTNWIRTYHPELVIIGNAGGGLFSNQLAYGKLVDVLVSTERSYEDASRNDWGGLVDANPAVATYQLALIHSVKSASTDPEVKAQEESTWLQTALEQVRRKKYSHVYVAYKDDPVPNSLYEPIWSIIPPFFEEEVGSITYSW